MPTEKEKMLSGKLYNALDEELSTERTNARILLQQLNNADPADTEKLNTTLKALIPNAGQDLWIQPPFYCDYGYNIEAGDKVFFNFNYSVPMSRSIPPCILLIMLKGQRDLNLPSPLL